MKYLKIKSCSICGINCSGKLEILVYTKEYPVCKYCFNDNLTTSMKELTKLIKKVNI